MMTKYDILHGVLDDMIGYKDPSLFNRRIK